MPVKGVKNATRNRKANSTDAEAEDIFSDLPSGDFAGLPQSLEAALGALVRVCTRRGGYVGISITDDGGSAKLTIRTGNFHADRRFYKLADFEAAVAQVFGKLRE